MFGQKALLLLTKREIHCIILLIYKVIKRIIMEPKDYTVSKIQGEYAILKDIVSGEELFIAMALLPLGVDVGSRLHYEMLEYTLVG